MRTRQHCGLSFWTITETARGRYLGDNCFDVPAQSYGEGYATGMLKAVEFFEALARGGQHFSVSLILCEVFSALQESDQAESRRGAACGFVHALTQSLYTVAQVADMRSWAESEIGAMQQWKVRDSERQRTEGQAFAARMQAARAAKRAQGAAQ